MSDNEAKEKLVDLVVENVKDKSSRNELLYYIFNGHIICPSDIYHRNSI